jgi:pyrroloquinoline quinone (PQQ) biosynthesis protein C
MEVCMSDLEPELEQFLAQLDQNLDVDGVSVLSHPALRELSAGTLPIDGLRNWAGQFYHCIRNSARSFGVVFVNLPDEDLDLRRSLAANIFEEDAGGMSGTDNHNELFFGFAQAIGLSREAILATPRGPEAAALMGDFEVRKMSRDEALEWLCIRGVGMERANARISDVTAKALRKHYDLKPFDTRFFDVHVEVDEDHGEFAHTVLRRFATSAERRANLMEKIVAGARSFYRVWDTALRTTPLPTL